MRHRRARPEARRFTRREALQLGGGAMLLALVGAACDDTPETGEPEPTASPDGPRIVDEAEPGGVGGGVLRLGLPHEARYPAALLYSTLVVVDPRTGAVHGDLAESIERRGPLTVALQLRPDTRFHPDADGLAAAVTSEDVVRSFEARADSSDFLFTTVLASVSAPDPRTVLLELNAPFSLLFEFLGDAGSTGVRSLERYGGTSIDRGSGPFLPLLVAAESETLAPHPVYHRSGLPLLDGIEVVRAEGEAGVAALFGGGETDIGQVAQTADERAGSVAMQRSSRRMCGLGLSLLADKGRGPVRFNEAFQDERVRRAIAISLNRQAIADLLEGTTSGPVGPGHPADALPTAELNDHPLYVRDAEEARSLLEAAEQVGLEMRIEAPTRSPLRQLAQAVEGQLAEVGFDVRLQLVPAEEWEADLLSGNFEAILFDLESLDTPDVGLRLHTAGGVDETGSLWGYSNPVYDAAVRAALLELDPVARARQSREAQRQLLHDVPAMLPLTSPTDHILVSDRLRGYEFGAYEFNERWMPARWAVEEA